MLKLQLWLITETPKARLFKRTAPGSIVAPELDQVWIPRSVTPRILKYAEAGGHIRCEVDAPDWFVEKYNLGTSVL